MDNQKISLDIRTILAKLNINYERFTEWKENNQVEPWKNKEWLETSEDYEQQVAVVNQG